MTDQYDVWLRRLHDHGRPEMNSPIGAGFWRLVSSKGHARPIATWSEDGVWCVSRHGLDVFDSDEDTGLFLKFMADGWHNLEAWTEEDYDVACETGVWPDHVPAHPRPATPSNPVEPEVANPSLGHNEPPEDSKFLGLVDALDALVAEAKLMADRGPATTQAEADETANFKVRIRDLRQAILAEHRIAKGPSLAEGRRIDGLYFEQRDRCTKLEARLHEVRLRPYLLAKQAEINAAREAAAAAKAAGQTEPEVPDDKATAGAKGRRTSLRKRWIGEITDYDSFYNAVREHDEVREFMVAYGQKIAANLFKINASVDGLKITEELI